MKLEACEEKASLRVHPLVVCLQRFGVGVNKRQRQEDDGEWEERLLLAMAFSVGESVANSA